MSSVTRPNGRADLIAAWAVGVGAGLLTLMIAWLVANRVLGLVLEAPEGPTVALIAAFVLGLITTAVVGQRCVRTITPGSNVSR